LASRFPTLQLTTWGAGPTAVADPDTAHIGVPVHEYSSVESQRNVTELPDGARYEFWNVTAVAAEGPPFVTFVAYVTRLLLVVTPSYPSGSALTPTKLGTITPAFVPLQAADFLAYEVMKICKELGAGNITENKIRWGIKEFQKMPGEIKIATTEVLIQSALQQRVSQDKDG